MIVLLVPIWILFFRILNIINQNIKRNLISSVHSMICIILCYQNKNNMIYYWSTSYYVYDLIIQLIFSPTIYNTTNMTLSLHHIIAVYTLEYLRTSDKNFLELFMFMFLILEVSNIPMYLMYHWIQINKKKENENIYNKIITKLLLILEMLAFLILRIIYSLYVLVTTYHLLSYDIILISILLYMMSVFWWTSMVHQLIK